MALVDHSETQKEYPKSYERWSRKDDLALLQLCEEGASLVHMAGELGRGPTAIKRRIENLGLVVEKEKVGEVEKRVLGYNREQVEAAIRKGIGIAAERLTGLAIADDSEEMLEGVQEGLLVLEQNLESEGE